MNAFHYLFALLFMGTLDAAWIGGNKTMYREAVESIQAQPMQVNIPAVLLSYAVIYVALVCVALPSVLRKHSDLHFFREYSALELFKRSMKYGGSLGFLIYAVYNLTTKAILYKYPWKVCVLDTTWGTVLFTFVCFFTALITKACQAHRGCSNKRDDATKKYG